MNKLTRVCKVMFAVRMDQQQRRDCQLARSRAVVNDAAAHHNAY